MAKTHVCPKCGFSQQGEENCPRCDQIGKAVEMVEIPELGCVAVKGLMAKPGHPMSRDFAMPTIKCGASACIANRAGECICPSLIKLDAAHKCLGFQTADKKKT